MLSFLENLSAWRAPLISEAGPPFFQLGVFVYSRPLRINGNSGFIMAGQHWGERDDGPSRLENAIVGAVSTGLTLGYVGLLLLLAVGFLRA